MDQVYQQLAVSQDGDSILNDVYGHDISITESGDITAQDITCQNISVSGTISGTINGVINQSSVSAEEITLTGSEVNTTNGVLYKKADNKLYNDAGLVYIDSQSILSTVNFECSTLKVATNAVVAFEESKASLYAHGQSSYPAISQNILTGDTVVDSGGTTSLLSQGINGIRVNAENNTTEYQNNTHRFTNISSEPQLFISPSGDVGLGVEQPVSKLHLSDVGGCSIRLDSVAPITGGSRIIFAEETLTKYQIANTENNDFLIAEGNDYIFYHDVSLSKTNLSGLLYIDGANSAVGVGSASPGAKFDISASSTTPALRIVQTGVGDCIQIQDQANDTTRFAVDSDGDVSIKRAAKLGTSCLTMVGVENLSGVNSICFDTINGQGGFDYWSKSMIMGGYLNHDSGHITLSNSNGPAAPGAIFGSYLICDGGDTHIGSCNIAHTGDVTGDLSEIAGEYTRVFIDGSSGKVGVNNLTPFSDLDVKSTVADGVASNVFVARNKTGSKLFEVSKDSINGCFVDFYDGSQSVAARIRANGSSYFNGGNIGLNTQSPQATLHLVDQATNEPTISNNTGVIIEDRTNYESANGGALFGNGLWFKSDAQNRYTSSGAQIQTLCGIRATYANIQSLTDSTQASMGLEFYTSDGCDGASPPTANLGSRMLLTHDGRLSVGNQSPSLSAKLQVDSTDSGFLPPRLTSFERLGISSPATGLIVYDTDLDSLFIKNTSNWSQLNSSGGVNVNDFMILRKTVNDISQSDIAWDTHTKFSPSGLFNYTNTQTTFTVNQTGIYKIEFTGSFYDSNVTGEKEVYFIFKSTAGTISSSIGFISRADSATTYSNLSYLDVVTLSVGVSYNFSFTSNTGQTASMYANGRCLITYLS